MPNKMTQWLEQERGRWPLWVPVWFAIGIGWYFSLPKEPAALMHGLGVLAWVVMAIAFRRRLRFRLLSAVLALMATGFSMAAWHAQRQDVRVLDKPVKMAKISGRLVELNATEKGQRLLLDEVTIEGVPPEQTPQRVRVSFRGKDWQALTGDRLSMRASLMIPSGAVMPDGFDFARFFYFRGIGAVGYAIPPIDTLSQDTHTDGAWLLWVNQQRMELSDRIRALMSRDAGSVAVALTTGDMASIPKQVNDDMRATNLTHILSISGLHMAIVVGLVFVSIRLLLVALPWTRHRRGIKQMAAAVALIAGLAYLYLSGLQVAAIRAYVMAAFLLVAVLVGREATPMRSLAWAALLLLVVQPSTILDPSFQLSFAATLALIAFYEGIRDQARSEFMVHSYARRLLLYVVGILLTSVVAELATLPIILYHFHTMSIYGLLANLLVSPLVSFVIMPGLLVGVMLMPFGAEAWVFRIVEWGIGCMLDVAADLAVRPYARLMVEGMPDWGLYLMVFGGLWVCLWRTPVRYAGVLLVGLGALSWSTVTKPDLLISPDGKQIAARLGERYAMLQGRPKGFMADQWAAALGQTELDKAPKDHPDFRCDLMGCIYRYHGQVIALAKEMDSLREDCQHSDLLIAPFYVKKERCEHPRHIIDRGNLKAHGAHWVWLDGQEVRVRFSAQEQGQRPWSVYQQPEAPQESSHQEPSSPQESQTVDPQEVPASSEVP